MQDVEPTTNGAEHALTPHEITRILNFTENGDTDTELTESRHLLQSDNDTEIELPETQETQETPEDSDKTNTNDDDSVDGKSQEDKPLSSIEAVATEQVIDNKDDHMHMEVESCQTEQSKGSLQFKQRCGLLFKPFINYECNEKDNTMTVTVVPEALRIYFYLTFFAFTFFCMAITLLFNDYDTIINDNLIQDVYGANNICIFFDSPPVSYMAAFLFVPLVIMLCIYLLVDAIRVHFNHTSGNHPALTSGFIKIYTCLSVFTALSICFFIQVFATQPDQYMPMHTGPFLFLTYGLWTMAFSHFLYFIKIGVIKRGHPWYFLGHAYSLSMGIVIVIKSALNGPNSFGARIWEKDGWGWTRELGSINDKLFMIIVVILPFVIYFIFVTKLDHVQITFKWIPCAVKSK